MKILKPSTTINNDVNLITDVEPTPVLSKETKQEETPQFDYNLHSKVEVRSNKPTNLPTTFAFEDCIFTIVTNIKQK